MVANRKQFSVGAFMGAVYVLALLVMFVPFFRGKNAFEVADDFFNSIAKGSTYYMEELSKSAKSYAGRTIDVTMRMGDSELAASAAKLLRAAGALVELSGPQMRAAGDLFNITSCAIRDSDDMFHNKGEQVKSRYSMAEKEVLHAWWMILKEMEKDLKRQKKFEEGRWVSTVSKKAVEVGYNFYEIEAKRVSDTVGKMAFSLVFYVIYTMWWGYAILFLCEGLGLRMKPGAKKEV